MSEEELKAIEYIEKDILEWLNKGKDYVIIDVGNKYKLMTIINLINKQQAELEKLKSINTINEAMIELLKDKTSIQEDIIRSFESGEMIGGKKI